MRPNRVYPNKLNLYTKKHTQKIKMMSGVELTALYLLKETNQYYISIDSWAFCCSTLKRKKKNLNLNLNLPILEDLETIEILNENSNLDWLESGLNNNESDMVESFNFLRDLFPNKHITYLPEFSNYIVLNYCWDKLNLNNERNKDEKSINRLKRLNRKFIEFSHIDTYKPLFEKLNSGEIDMKTFISERDDFLFKNYNIIDKLNLIGKNTIVCPYIFSDRCVEGSSYENAGEIYMVVTKDTVYFECSRHF
jgi:hypothetical protein